MKFVIEEKGRNPKKNQPTPRFARHEIYIECPRQELGTHEDARILKLFNKLISLNLIDQLN